jgi:Ca2+-binding RTX toxin-like protein
VSEVDSDGIDTVRSSVTYTLGDNLERLFLTGADNIEGTGNNLDNTILGNGGINVLRGEAGNDTINGADGDDTLIGGAGNDYLTGGAGVNTFRFYDSGEGIDIISDFKAGTDKIQISANGFDETMSLGRLDATAFIAGAGITSASDHAHRFIYNTSNGALFFDADGNGSHSSSIQIAVLSGTPALSNTDIFVI